MIGLGRLRVGVGAVGLMVAGLGWMPEGTADSFYLKTGDVVEGEILEATRNTVILRSGGAIRPTSLGLIERVVLTLADGSEITGEFVGWENGVFEIRSADLLVQVRDGEIIGGDTKVASPKIEKESASQPEPSEPEPSEVAMQGLPEFTLKNGRVVLGRIIHATGSIVTIRLHAGGVVPASRAQIDTVRFVGADGGVLDGRFVDWSDDVYQLKNGDRDVLASLSDRAAEAGPPLALQSQPVTPELPEKPVIAAIESADAAISPDADVDPGADSDANNSSTPSEPSIVANEEAAAELSDAAGVGGPASETAVAGLADPGASPAVSDEKEVDPGLANGPHLIEPTVADVGEDGGEVVFEFRLKQPTDRPLVILYAATDDTAQAGKDFEAKSGVITFSVGSEYAEVRVPLIDDEQSETTEQFHLFLSGDPETIQFSKRQIPATINDND